MTVLLVVVCGIGFGLGFASLLSIAAERVGGPRRLADAGLQGTRAWSDSERGGRDAPFNSTIVLDRTLGPSVRTRSMLLIGLFEAVGRGSASRGARRLLTALCIAAATGMTTGWPIGVPIAGVASIGVPVLLDKLTDTRQVRISEAIATWAELLEGTLASSAGLQQAIVATAASTPMEIRAATVRLAARLEAGAHAVDALAQLASEVDDPIADRLIAALLLVANAPAHRVAELLGELARSTREEAAIQMRVDSSRASIVSGTRIVILFSVGFAAALAMFARAYLEPFNTMVGQFMLGGIAVLYALALAGMVTIARRPHGEARMEFGVGAW